MQPEKEYIPTLFLLSRLSPACIPTRFKQGLLCIYSLPRRFFRVVFVDTNPLIFCLILLDGKSPVG
ncbi:MAG: hypothetical protein D3914_13255 [Candidatus Electrothrix sp. LOE2]|nr:hypothetical protein [Candidatus Electrothrix sp. LOE2]